MIEKPYLLSFRWTREDNPIQYKLVYATTEAQAKKKLSNWVTKHRYGDMGAKAEALDTQNETIL